MYTEKMANATFNDVHDSYEYVACEWMKSNDNTWRAWKPNQANALHIGGIFPITGSYTAKGVVTGTY
jgi:hypothetical protein